jgi:hypothetical protein
MLASKPNHPAILALLAEAFLKSQQYIKSYCLLSKLSRENPSPETEKLLVVAKKGLITRRNSKSMIT